LRKNLGLRKYKYLGLDTNVFIYYLQAHSKFGPYAKKVISALVSDKATAVTSILTLAEVLAFGGTKVEITKTQDYLFSIPNLSFISVGVRIAQVAAGIRREFRFSLPDSIQLATALDAKAQTFITNDKRLLLFRRLPVTLLTEI